MTASILLIEDSPSLSRVYQEYLRGEEFDVQAVENGTDALAIIHKGVPDVLLLDLHLPDMDGMEILRQVKALPDGANCDVIVITANGSVSVAVEAIRAGAKDFLVKPFTADRLLVTLNTLLQHRFVDEVDKTPISDDGMFVDFVGDSPGMRTVYRIINQAAPSTATVFITGESGTGKELCAQAIHKISPRRKGPFVALNCGAIPKELMENEIFGHAKGAFTGAVADAPGAAHQANGGTLFLDEICEMDLELQVKLLRFIQTGSFNRVGSSRPEKVDVRFVCATNKDPLAMVEKGLFREDLYYRLHVVPIEMPPLRARGEDVLHIAEFILKKQNIEEGKSFCRFDDSAQNILVGYDWPGNVRQLENVIRNMVVLNSGDLITTDMLPVQISQGRGKIASGNSNDGTQINVLNRGVSKEISIRPLWKTERDAIKQAIAFCEGNIPKAAKLLEVSPSTIYRKLQSWEERETKNSA